MTGWDTEGLLRTHPSPGPMSRFLLAFLLVPVPLLAQAGSRELSADRPDTTESPLSVEPGRIQLESSVADWSREDGGETLALAILNLKLGLTRSTDLQLVLDGHRLGGDGPDGFGDLALRGKWNLWGNDGGSTALGLLPWVGIPTRSAAASDAWQGGLAVPFAIDLRQGVSLGLMPGVDLAAAADGGHDAEFLHTAVLGFALTGRLGLYTEYIGAAAAEDYLAHASAGLTYAVGPDLQLDCGAVLGLNEAAPDLRLFTGFTWRY